jgi:hemerythrin superfamily protein
MFYGKGKSLSVNQDGGSETTRAPLRRVSARSALGNDGPMTTPDPHPPADIVDVLTTDHRAAAELFDRLLADGTPSPQFRRDMVDVLIAELMRHATAEEQYLYPAVRRHLPDGAELADRELVEHAQAEALMSRLMDTDAEDPLFDTLVGQLALDVRQHVHGEETELFPRLRALVDPAALVRLGTEILGAKKIAPTRPHPGSPHHPPMNRIAGPVMGLVDRAVDSLTDRPTTVAELPD